MTGLVAFVPAFRVMAAMGSPGACGASLRHGHPAGCHFGQAFGGRQLDRNEDRLHPGEGSATT
jgi:hypothetical protein